MKCIVGVLMCDLYNNVEYRIVKLGQGETEVLLEVAFIQTQLLK